MYYFYFDASGLIKRYTQEIGSDKTNETGEQLMQGQVIERLTGGQLSMFGEDRFHSGLPCMG